MLNIFGEFSKYHLELSSSLFFFFFVDAGICRIGTIQTVTAFQRFFPWILHAYVSELYLNTEKYC